MSDVFLNQELRKRGYQDNWGGTGYVRAAVRMVATEPVRKVPITKEVYPGLARAAGCSIAAIERMMRYAVHKAEPGKTVSQAVNEMAVIVRTYAD